MKIFCLLLVFSAFFSCSQKQETFTPTIEITKTAILFHGDSILSVEALQNDTLNQEYYRKEIYNAITRKDSIDRINLNDSTITTKQRNFTYDTLSLQANDSTDYETLIKVLYSFKRKGYGSVTLLPSKENDSLATVTLNIKKRRSRDFSNMHEQYVPRPKEEKLNINIFDEEDGITLGAKGGFLPKFNKKNSTNTDDKRVILLCNRLSEPFFNNNFSPIDKNNKPFNGDTLRVAKKSLRKNMIDKQIGNYCDSIYFSKTHTIFKRDFRTDNRLILKDNRKNYLDSNTAKFYKAIDSLTEIKVSIIDYEIFNADSNYIYKKCSADEMITVYLAMVSLQFRDISDNNRCELTFSNSTKYHRVLLFARTVAEAGMKEITLTHIENTHISNLLGFSSAKPVGALGKVSIVHITLNDKNNSRSIITIKNILQKRLSGLRHTYARILKMKKTEFQGEISLMLSIDPSGNVFSITKISSSFDDVEFEKSVMNRIKRFKFGRVEKGNQTFEVELGFRKYKEEK